MNDENQAFSFYQHFEWKWQFLIYLSYDNSSFITHHFLSQFVPQCHAVSSWIA